MRFRNMFMLAVLAAAGCRTSSPPLPAISVDTSLRPDRASLPGPGGSARPLGVVADAQGHRAQFVERELIVVTNDDAALAAFASRWRGTIVQSFDPARYHLPALPRIHLVRIDPTVADAATLAANLRALDPHSTGELRVSSASGLGLMTAAAAEARAGTAVGVNWVAEPADLRGRSIADAPSGPPGYTPNAFAWISMTHDAPLRIGVADAWRALDLAGRLGGPRIPIAILDAGFAGTHLDYPPPGPVFLSALPFITDARDFPNLGCLGRTPCPWHGTSAALTAMGVPDNGIGAAGPAGPVASPILTLTLGDFITAIPAVVMARDAGATIISMSFDAPIPEPLGFSALPFDLTTNVVRSQNVLLFGAAGNGRTDVDGETCFLGCWENTWHTPCENNGVTCVGATNAGDRARADFSNFGGRTDGGTVDFWAPTGQFVGMEFDATGAFLQPPAPGSNMVNTFGGTSAATPFVAGIAALVWAANPGLSADQVEQILADTSVPGDTPEVRRFVRAYEAVIAVLGGRPNEPPSVAIDDPPSPVYPGEPFQLTAHASDPDQPAGIDCGEIRWSSPDPEVRIDPATGCAVRVTATSAGTYHVTVSVVDAGGMRVETTREVTVSPAPRNRGPDVTIRSTPPEVPWGGSVTLRADAIDPEGDGPITYTWTVTAYDQYGQRTVDLGRGPQVEFSPDRLSLNGACWGLPGHAQITVTARDRYGNPRSTSVTIEIVCTMS